MREWRYHVRNTAIHKRVLPSHKPIFKFAVALARFALITNLRATAIASYSSRSGTVYVGLNHGVARRVSVPAYLAWSQVKISAR